MRLVLFGAGAGAAIALIWGAAIAALIAWNYAAHKRPAGGEPPLLPRGGEGSHLPGLIPPPPATHHCGGVARLIDIRTNGCIWVWRRGHGWQQASVCVPSDDDWDEWLATLPLEDT